MVGCNPIKNPIIPGEKLTSDPEGKMIDNTFYKQIILLLQRGYFVTCKVQTDFGLFYKRSENSDLIGFSDSDYARD